MNSKTFFAIYNTETKMFKGRGNMGGARWSEYPTQTYETEGKARGALKGHVAARFKHPHGPYQEAQEIEYTNKLTVIPITVSW